MGRLNVTVIGARNLPDQMVGMPDPYCRLSLDGQKCETRVLASTVNPQWREAFGFFVADENASQLVVKVKNKNIVSDDLLGEYRLSLSGLIKGVAREGCYLLRNCRTNSEIHLSVTAVDFGADPSVVAPLPQPLPWLPAMHPAEPTVAYGAQWLPPPPLQASAPPDDQQLAPATNPPRTEEGTAVVTPPSHSSSSFLVEVKTLSGESFAIEVQPQETVLDVKRKIQAVHNVDTDDQRIIFDGRELSAHAALDTYAIHPHTTLRLIVRKRQVPPVGPPAAGPGGRKMPIEVKTLTCRSIPLEVDPNDTVLSVKMQIQVLENVEAVNQRLVYAGRLIDDDKTLMSYSISKDSTLHLIVRIHEPDPPRSPEQPTLVPVAQPQQRASSPTSVKLIRVTGHFPELKKAVPLQQEGSPVIIMSSCNVASPCDSCGRWEDAVRYRALSFTGLVLVCHSCLETIALYEAPSNSEQWVASLDSVVVPLRNLDDAAWGQPYGRKLLQQVQHLFLSNHSGLSKADRIPAGIRGLFMDSRSHVPADVLSSLVQAGCITHLHLKFSLPQGQEVPATLFTRLKAAESLRFRGISITESAFKELTSLLARSTTLRMMSLGYSDAHGTAGLGLAVNALGTVPMLELLELTGSEAAVLALPRSLKSSSLHCLCVTSAELSEGACSALSTLLSSHAATLQSVDFSNTTLRGKGGEELFRALGSAQHLRHLVLDTVENAPPSGTAILTAGPDLEQVKTAWSALASETILRLLPSLRILNLANARLTDDDLRSLRQGLVGIQHSLESLDLSGVRWRPVFAGNPEQEHITKTLRVLKLCDHPRSGSTSRFALLGSCSSLTLTEIDISYSTNVDLKKLLENLHAQPCLRALKLCTTGMTNDHCPLLRDALHKNPHLDSLDISHNRLVECNGDEVALFEILASLSRARFVNVSSTIHVMLEDATTWSLLAIVVREMQLLRELRLADNHLTCVAANELSRALLSLPFLELLDLSSNFILRSSRDRLKTALAESSKKLLRESTRCVSLVLSETK